jgi:TonB family protein
MIFNHHLKLFGLENSYRLLNLFTNNVRITRLIKLKIAVGIALLSSKYTAAQTVEFPNQINHTDTLRLDVELKEQVSCYLTTIVINSYPTKEPINIQEQKFLDKFVKENVQYPDSAFNNKIEGNVAVNIIIDEEGKIIFAEVIKKRGYGLDEEALRLVNLLPNFITAKRIRNISPKNRTIIIHFELPK